MDIDKQDTLIEAIRIVNTNVITVINMITNNDKGKEIIIEKTVDEILEPTDKNYEIKEKEIKSIYSNKIPNFEIGKSIQVFYAKKREENQ